MRRKQCKRCGAVFDCDKEEAYLCPSCSIQAKRESAVRPRTCRQCGTVFDGGPRAWYCPACRAERRRTQNREWKKREPARNLGSIDHCARCGAEYIVEGSLQKYCKACAAEAVAEVTRPKKREYNQAHKDTLYPHKDAMRRYNKVCVVCGKVFDTGKPTVTCSEACAREQHRRVRARIESKRSKKKRGKD